ncbi:hypothetical protein INF73_21910 [Enterobacter cloacae complex sp. P6RS]|uniref:hypothetical protein n=1 Tax=Enterobacter cloacae complex sp. P6RS TaxID=2779588 RepID=UPI0018767B7D|nr:hypothetical protein [Enterobacter cloacae complex sp. P6RS]MBE4994533.1 hypothetical protein [Enterobacter cloacae complex sp. P6RS]
MSACKYPGNQIKHFITAMLILAFTTLISGCHNINTTTPPKKTGFNPSPIVYSAPVKERPIKQAAVSSQAITCQRELSSLSGINASDYAGKRAAFESLVRSANAYKEVREQMSPDMRDSMDSFYKFKMLRLCNQIEMSLQQGLIAIEGDRSEIK